MTHTIRDSARVALVLALAGIASTAFGQASPPASQPAQDQDMKLRPARASEPKAAGPTTGPTTAAAVAASATKVSATQLGVSFETYSSGIPQRDTLARLLRTVSVDLKETRLEDVMTFIQESTQADMDVLWSDGFVLGGLEKDKAITLKASNRTFLQLLESVLERASSEGGSTDAATWQMTESGAMQVGARSQLNKYRRLEIYPISDLILDLPDYNNAPIFDLQQAFQQNSGGRGGGGGGGQSPFTDSGGNEREERRPAQERADELMDIIRSVVEPDQWDQGDAGPTMRFFQGSLLINAPDYVHRQINGYSWWPSAATQARSTGGRRYVTLGVDTGITGLPEFQNLPVTGVVPGGGPGSGPPGGGG